MSTAYHPQTDGASERTNKTLNQAICYHVDNNQKGWLSKLLRIHFAIMNTVNIYWVLTFSAKDGQITSSHSSSHSCNYQCHTC
jgi:hypothetical protein